MNFEWIVKSPEKEKVRRLVEEFKIPDILAILLVNRGIVDSHEVKYFLNPEMAEFIDPYNMNGIKEGIEFLLRSKNEKILIYGDYDVDGVTGTALLCKVLKRLGWNVGYYVPNRMEEGYGLTMDIMEKMVENDFKILITVDCGITSIEEIKYAKELGINVIVTDHHEPKGELPPADVIVNPKLPNDNYPFKGLAGVGVAFKFLKALVDSMNAKFDMDEYMDLVALGTIGDIVPIVNENRIIVKKGLSRLRNTKNIGLKALMESIGMDMTNVTAQDVGFKLVPRLNAAGRVDDASIAIELLLTEDELKARRYAETLIQHNLKRQSIGNEILFEALCKIEEGESSERRAIVVASRGWHPGVIGIVASKLINRFYKPTFLISIDENGIGRGSARSIEGINIMELLNKSADLLEEFGGHKMAAGFTIKEEMIGKFEERINELLEDYPSDIFSPKIFIDAQLNLDDLNDDLLYAVETLGPYGQSNPEPLFAFKDLSLEQTKSPQLNTDFLKMIVSQNGRKMEVVSFNGFRFKDLKFMKPQFLKLDLVGSVRKRMDHGMPVVHIQMVDMKLKMESIFNEDGKFVTQILKREHLDSHDDKFQLDDAREFVKNSFLKDDTLKKLGESDRTILLVDPKTKNFVLCDEILRNLDCEKRTLVLASVNLELYHSYHTLKRFFGGFMDYRNSINRDSKKNVNDSVVFSTIQYFLKYIDSFRNFDSVIIMEPFYLGKNMDKNMEDCLEILKENFKRIIIVASMFGDEEASKFERLFQPMYVVKNINRKREIGLIDLRNVKNKIEYIEDLIRENETIIVVVTSPQKTIDIAKKVGEKFQNMFKNGSIVPYSEYLDPSHMRRIENMVRKNKVKVMITTPVAINIPLQNDEVNIIYYDAPRFPGELLSPMYAVNGKMVVVHLVFNEDDVKNNIKLVNSLFPDKSRILKVWNTIGRDPKKLMKDDESVKKLLKQGVIYRKSHIKIYANILKDLQAFERGNVENLETSLRYREGFVERNLVSEFGRKLMNYNTKEFFRLITSFNELIV